MNSFDEIKRIQTIQVDLIRQRDKYQRKWESQDPNQRRPLTRQLYREIGRLNRLIEANDRHLVRLRTVLA